MASVVKIGAFNKAIIHKKELPGYMQVRDPHNYEDPTLYLTGDMVQQSIALGPEILKASIYNISYCYYSIEDYPKALKYARFWHYAKR